MGQEIRRVSLRLRNQPLEISVSGREWEHVLHGMARPLLSKVNEL